MAYIRISMLFKSFKNVGNYILFNFQNIFILKKYNVHLSMTACFIVYIVFVKISPKSAITIPFIRKTEVKVVARFRHWQTTGACSSYIFTSPCMCNCEPLCDKTIKPGKEHLKTRTTFLIVHFQLKVQFVYTIYSHCDKRLTWWDRIAHLVKEMYWTTVKLGCVEVQGTQRILRLIRCFDTSVRSFDCRFTRCLPVKLTSGLTCATYSLRLCMYDLFQV